MNLKSKSKTYSLPRFLVLLVLFIGMSTRVHAQQGDAMKQSLNDLMIVGVVGAGGAILGLSTLSFYDEPSKHYKNILIGGAIGIIIGVGIVVFNQATSKKESFDEASLLTPESTPEFEFAQRQVWHYEKNAQVIGSSLEIPAYTYVTTF